MDFTWVVPAIIAGLMIRFIWRRVSGYLPSSNPALRSTRYDMHRYEKFPYRVGDRLPGPSYFSDYFGGSYAPNRYRKRLVVADECMDCLGTGSELYSDGSPWNNGSILAERRCESCIGTGRQGERLRQQRIIDRQNYLAWLRQEGLTEEEHQGILAEQERRDALEHARNMAEMAKLEKRTRCGKCKGTGVIIQGSPAANAVGTFTCSRCGGTGRIGQYP